MQQSNDRKFWYNKPAGEWLNGLPVGNGRLAAMVWDDTGIDTLSLNHEWLWRGCNRFRDNHEAAGQLRTIRDCLKRGDFFLATSLANAWLGGHGGISGLPGRVDAYQPAGDLRFVIDSVVAYEQRELDLRDGIIDIKRTIQGGGSLQSQILVHPQLNLVMAHWQGPVNGRLLFQRPTDPGARESLDCQANGFLYRCSFDGGINYAVRVDLVTDGVLSIQDQAYVIRDASYLTALINIATSVRGIEEELAAWPIPAAYTWTDCLQSHRAAFRALTDRYALQIDLPSSAEPTDRRIDALRQGQDDPALLALFCEYGRYLLIAASVSGELPANLQGKWNHEVKPPWDSDYHFDINLQMNYWAAESLNLPECVEALLLYVERMVPHAREAARKLYGCRGIWFPIQTDAWDRSTPESCGWAVWIGAAPWIAQHFWWHYQYSGDLTFLRQRAYPFFCDVAAFLEDYLEEDDQHVLQIMPSQSPENRFAGTGYWPVSLGISAAMDVQLAYDALGYAIRSARLLGVDQERAVQWEQMQRKLPSFAIGQDGRLLEWDQERSEVEPGHRHLSHLYGLFPSDLFNPEERPDQYAASVKSLAHRLAQGGGHTGWSRAWVACLSARIGDGSQVWHHLKEMIREFATDSLLDLHPPRIFQIDGNLGAAAAVQEALIQTWNGKLRLLRALPAEWPNGSMTGCRVPGGHLVDLAWKDGRLTSLDVTMGYTSELVVCLPDGSEHTLRGQAGARVSLSF